ncbi:hypothetical protein DPMN_051531 [Dreissena polymorpha]|uniref:Uncharacterized protein n=1 Tax=Dreissena polymorpha TaxID=45954 RepID=A0A9D4HM79_DREPO|nr:hypothetical protein DPMN_051531 [Dreissena polymorpha]
MQPQGAIPMAMAGFVDVEATLNSFTASPTPRPTPACIPPVTIQAPFKRGNDRAFTYTSICSHQKLEIPYSGIRCLVYFDK